MHEVLGNMHIHTPYSDGEKWHKEIAEDAIRAGLDFIIVTDHNVWVHGLEGYYENGDGRVLVLTGEEVHDVRRQPQENHFLAYGAQKELAPYAPDEQELINATNEAGGHGFLAHPFERDLDLFGGDELGWHCWDVEGYRGLEIWNYMSSFKNEIARSLDNMRWRNGLLARIKVVRMALNPERHIYGPDKQVLEKWDELLASGQRVAGVGNSDAHGTPMSMGPITRTIFPYEFLFRAVNTHLLLPEPLGDDVEKDRAMIIEAIANGKSWIAYDMAHPTRGFRFSGQGVNKGSMGDEIKLDAGATLQVLAPVRANIRLIRHGEVVAEIENEQNLTHMPVEPGAYRAECYIPYEDKLRGWIFSNPIYLV